jgi:ribonuclease D
VPLLEPSEGIPPVVGDADLLASTTAAFAAGSGPVAIDAERASGYRYTQRAYLIQLRRAGAGSALIDPIACPDLGELATAIEDAEWVLHAASQDLPCMAELGMRPKQLFDTELAARLAGYPRVGLGPLVQSVLGLTLDKQHSAADWSTRPLPEPWLRYATLDVEVLVELRDALEAVLDEQGKLDWARQEFAALVTAPLPGPRPDPWRRTSGLHRVRKRRQLAAVRGLWLERDAAARRRDVSPSRVLPDSAIVDAALAMPTSASRLRALPGYANRRSDDISRYVAALNAARVLAEDELPELAMASSGPPPPRAWQDRDPAAARRLQAARAGVTALAEQHTLPVENLLSPDLVRRLCWTPPEDTSPTGVAATLRAGGARQWQIELTAEVLSTALRTEPV